MPSPLPSSLVSAIAVGAPLLLETPRPPTRGSLLTSYTAIPAGKRTVTRAVPTGRLQCVRSRSNTRCRERCQAQSSVYGVADDVVVIATRERDIQGPDT